MIASLGLAGRGSAYGLQGKYDLALRDFNAALAMSGGKLEDLVRPQINEVKKQMAQSGGVTPSQIAPAPEAPSSQAQTVVLCPGDPNVRLKIDLSRAAVVENSGIRHRHMHL